MFFSYAALILRVLLLGVERIIVKFLGDQDGNLLKNIAATTVFFGLGAILLVPIIIFTGLELNIALIYYYLNSLVYSVAFVLYVASLAEGETSLVTPLNSTNIIFLLIFSTVFLGEKITSLKLIGTFLMLLGVSKLKKDSNMVQSIKLIIKDKPCLYMIMSAALLAIGRIVDKSFIKNIDSVTYTFFLYIFVAFNLTLVLLIKRRFIYVRDIMVEKPLFSFISGAINAYSYLFLLAAMKHIQVSIAEPLAQTSMIITIIISWIILKEEVRSKLLGIFLILISSCLLIMNI